MIDSSAVRAHRQATGSLRDGKSAQPERSRSGLNTKIHAVVNGNGQPKALGLTPGQAADCTVAEALLTEVEAGTIVFADKAYDTNAILDHPAEVGAIAIIPSKSDRTVPRHCKAVNTLPLR